MHSRAMLHPFVIDQLRSEKEGSVASNVVVRIGHEV